MESSGLIGAVAIVTGAGRGIGREIVRQLAAAGALVTAVDIDAAALDETVAEAGRNARAARGDVSNEDDVVAVVADVLGRHGKADVLVNNAGLTPQPVELFEMSATEWDHMHAVNLRGTFLCSREVSRAMVSAGSGRIICMSSIAAKGFRFTTNVAYASSKGAIVSFVRTAAVQLGRYGIAVNAICPGPTQTHEYVRIMGELRDERGITEDEAWLELADRVGIPLRRSNHPADIAALAVFLASDAARNISGQTISVDGGLIPS
jgi:NAD(P)-dependent dehydrogenase (short-subunit alcohol dehydrogenase family)